MSSVQIVVQIAGPKYFVSFFTSPDSAFIANFVAVLGMFAIGMGAALQLGNEPHLFMCLTCFQFFIFYCAHWQAYVSGALQMYTYVTMFTIYKTFVLLKLQSSNISYSFDLFLPLFNIINEC